MFFGGTIVGGLGGALTTLTAGALQLTGWTGLGYTAAGDGLAAGLSNIFFRGAVGAENSLATFSTDTALGMGFSGAFRVGGMLLGGAGTGGATQAGSAAESLISSAHVAELTANGVRFTPSALVATGRAPSGQVVFLEAGNARAGLQHIVARHGSDFARIGVAEGQIPGAVMRAVTQGRVVGYQGSGQGRPIYEILVGQQNQRIAVTTGNRDASH